MTKGTSKLSLEATRRLVCLFAWISVGFFSRADAFSPNKPHTAAHKSGPLLPTHYHYQPQHVLPHPSLQILQTRWQERSALLQSNSNTPDSSPAMNSRTRATAVYILLLINLMVFLSDNIFRNPFVARNLYLFHQAWKWWQPLTTTFCHTDRFHLSSNLFLLLLFGRSVEDDLGWGGLLLSYIVCGVSASLVSLVLLPAHTVSIGASGAVFGLFAVSCLAKLVSWRDVFDWRKLVEVAVLGEFVFRQMASEISTAASGGTVGVNHVAHLSGAAAGAIMVLGMRVVVANADLAEQERMNKMKRKSGKKGKDDNEHKE